MSGSPAADTITTSLYSCGNCSRSKCRMARRKAGSSLGWIRHTTWSSRSTVGKDWLPHDESRRPLRAATPKVRLMRS
ncbi:hypothetical protein LSM04_003180 [Trypanosoma melophagium]|uniref:uncharacterized protein n=1 Tax=Trypanosoma melophagium TaxID=715481 RepID=UPI00351A1748|nr:hypothetical protein LSM04_003180 [Trypanosoma melophagium]